MKCVCPMGGERTCPDDCLHASYWKLPEPDRKAQRKITAERYYAQHYTMEQIAQMLGVTQATISNDLQSLLTTNKLPPRTSKRGRKGEGRPKGSGKGKRQTKPRTAPEPDVARKMAEAVLDEGKTLEQVTAEFGAPSVQHAKLAIAREEGRREPQVDRTDLSLTAQEKFDVAIRQHKRKLDQQFERAVLDEVKKRIDEMILPHWKQKIDQAQQLFARRRGLMDKTTFNAIRRGLHPDSRNSISDKVLGEAFDKFMALEKFLLDEKDSPTDLSGLPSSWAEWEAAKQRATAARKAKRNAGSVARAR